MATQAKYCFWGYWSGQTVAQMSAETSSLVIRQGGQEVQVDYPEIDSLIMTLLKMKEKVDEQ